MNPILYIVVPCYNEKEVLPLTSEIFENKIKDLISCGKVSPQSQILFVNDGSRDTTWEIISDLCKKSNYMRGISLSRNRGHQNALLAGLMEAKSYADITISIDCDGQDDINAIDEMVDAYRGGAEIVYGVRADRKSDSFFKRTTAQGFYRFMNLLGSETVYNHADYRLLSTKVLNEFESFKEVNLFLRGLIPLVGFKSTCVYYERRARRAGESHYSFHKMLSLAFDGITSLSIKPIRIITALGVIVAILSFVGIIWSVVTALMGKTVAGWASVTCILCLLSGVQLVSLGVIGEYIGKIYLETKQRPRYIIAERTYKDED
ncbi:MAG: glycosyltransferase family 2 protein [Clostridia bacterium]|nr:glycosyltransferase family 2 protein [Clostridia bacterium]